MAVRRCSYKSSFIFLLNSSHSCLEKKGNSFLNFVSPKNLEIAVGRRLRESENEVKQRGDILHKHSERLGGGLVVVAVLEGS